MIGTIITIPPAPASKPSGVIYKLTFPNGKVYIGMTTVSLRRRLYCHGFKARAESPKLLLHRAWKLHGEPLVEVLETTNAVSLADAEIHYIRLFNSYGTGGYNMTPGGEDSPMKRPEIVAKVRVLALAPERVARTKILHTGSKRSLETRRLFSETRKGKPVSLEARRKMSITHKLKGTRGPDNTGRKNTDEVKARMSEAAKRRWARERSA